MQEALDVLARKGSALVIAHRLSTIMDSEKIVVVGSAKDGENQGTVMESGTHEELLAKAIPGEAEEEEDEDDDEDEEDTDEDDEGSFSGLSLCVRILQRVLSKLIPMGFTVHLRGAHSMQ